MPRWGTWITYQIMKLAILHLLLPFVLAAGAVGELATELLAKGFERPVWSVRRIP